jgi:hypothetical protein
VSAKTLSRLPTFSPAVSAKSDKPGIIDISIVADAPGNFLPFTANLRTSYSISYRQLVSNSPLTYGPVNQAYSTDIDSDGIPTPSSLSTTCSFPIPGLQEGQTYLISVQGVNEFGQSFTSPGATVVVAKTPAPVDFDGPVGIQITAANRLPASWKSKAAPQTAEVIIEFANNPNAKLQLPAKPDAANPLQLKWAATDADLLKVVNAALSGPPPVIKVQMTDASGKSVDRQFIFTFGVQSANKDKTATTTATASSSQNAAAALVDASNNPGKKKISWQDLVSSGLGSVLKAL